MLNLLLIQLDAKEGVPYVRHEYIYAWLLIRCHTYTKLLIRGRVWVNCDFITIGLISRLIKYTLNIDLWTRILCPSTSRILARRVIDSH